MGFDCGGQILESVSVLLATGFDYREDYLDEPTLPETKPYCRSEQSGPGTESLERQILSQLTLERGIWRRGLSLQEA